MKRLVWLFLAVFCTALAQVQPVELLLPKAKAPDCCACSGACGSPDCMLAPAPAQPPAEPAGTLTVARPAPLVAAFKLAQTTEKFFALFLPAAPAATDASAPPLPAPSPASVPLFAAHCSFLI